MTTTWLQTTWPQREHVAGKSCLPRFVMHARDIAFQRSVARNAIVTFIHAIYPAVKISTVRVRESIKFTCGRRGKLKRNPETRERKIAANSSEHEIAIRRIKSQLAYLCKCERHRLVARLRFNPLLKTNTKSLALNSQ